jgi:hypothetical protein
MRKIAGLLAVVCLTAIAVPGCNIFNDIGNAECAGMEGAGGDDGEGGAGGDDGAGGVPDQGAGGAIAASSAASVGAGGAPGGAGAGDTSGAGAGEGMGRSVPRAARAVARAPRRRPRHHRGGENIGTAVSATCGAVQPVPSACSNLSGWPLDGTTYDYCDSACVAQCGLPLMGTFASRIFKFVTTIADDGTGTAGGWQVANITLDFDRWTGLLPETWSCPVAIGFPLRTTAYGIISPAYAAVVSADIANQATSYIMHNPNEITPSMFCNMLPGTMNTVLATPSYKDLGGRATKQGVQ